MSTTPTPQELADSILQSATDGLASSNIDGQSFSEMNLKDRLDALDRLASGEAVAKHGPTGLMSVDRMISPHPND